MQTLSCSSSVSGLPVEAAADRTQTGSVQPGASSPKASRFAELKTKIRQADTARSFASLPLGVKRFDEALSGGLRFGHVHLVTGRPFDGAATGFVLAMLRALMMQDKTAPVVWCSAHHAGQAGHVLASALPAMGLSPSRFIFVHDQHPKRLMGAFEEVLQTKGILAAVGEYGLFARNTAVWQRWARRTRLAAQTGGAMGFLLGSPAPVGGFETGWQITSAPGNASSGVPDWRACWTTCLDYTRQGTSCSDRLRYDCLTGRLQLDTGSAQVCPDQAGQPVSGAYLPAPLSA